MSSQKKSRSDEVWNSLYAPFFSTGKSMNNQTNNRQLVLNRMYMRVLGELAMNRFEWKGFEGTGVDVRYLEMQLYFHALCVFFRDDGIVSNGELIQPGTGQYLAMRGNPSGTKNLVDNPTMFSVHGPTFNGRRIRAATWGSAPGNNNHVCVPVWANYFRSPDLDIVMIYSQKLAEIDRTIEINAKNARQTKILHYTENQRLTARNIQDMIDRGEATIETAFDPMSMMEVLDMSVDPDGIEKLSIVRQRLWNEAVSLLGINAANQDKKERLVADEVSANDDQVASVRRVNLNARQEAANEINRVYGLNVSVDYYSQPVEALQPSLDTSVDEYESEEV